MPETFRSSVVASVWSGDWTAGIPLGGIVLRNPQLPKSQLPKRRGDVWALGVGSWDFDSWLGLGRTAASRGAGRGRAAAQPQIDDELTVDVLRVLHRKIDDARPARGWTHERR